MVSTAVADKDEGEVEEEALGPTKSVDTISIDLMSGVQKLTAMNPLVERRRELPLGLSFWSVMSST